MILFSTLVNRGSTMLQVLGCPPDSRVVALAQEIETLCQLMEAEDNLTPFNPQGNAGGEYPHADERGIGWFISMLTVLNSRKRHDYKDPSAHDLTIRIHHLRKLLRAALED